MRRFQYWLNAFIGVAVTYRYLLIQRFLIKPLPHLERQTLPMFFRKKSLGYAHLLPFFDEFVNFTSSRKVFS